MDNLLLLIHAIVLKKLYWLGMALLVVLTTNHLVLSV
jgi:hypothetical protein